MQDTRGINSGLPCYESSVSSILPKLATSPISVPYFFYFLFVCTREGKKEKGDEKREHPILRVNSLMWHNELHNQDYRYYQTHCNERNCPKKCVGACRNSPYWKLADHVIRIYLSTLLAVKIGGQSMKFPSVRKTQIGAQKHRGFYFGEEILLTAFWTRTQEFPSRQTHVQLLKWSDLVSAVSRYRFILQSFRIFPKG